MKILHWIAQIFKKFKTKVFFLICTVSLIPLMVSIGILYNSSVYIMKNQVADIAHGSINYEIWIADNLFSTLEFYGERLASDEELIEICSDSGTWDYQQLTRRYRQSQGVFKKILNILRNSNMHADQISFYLYLCDKALIFDTKTTYYEKVEPENVQFLREYQRGEERWISTEQINEANLQDKELIIDTSQPVITKCFEIKNKDDRVVGILAVNVDSELFRNYYNEIQKGFMGETIITDADERVVLSSNKNLEKALNRSNYVNRNDYWEEVFIDNEHFMLMSGNLDSIDSKIYILVSVDTMLKNIKWLRGAYVLLLVLMAILGMMTARYITRIFYEPIDILKQNMGRVEKGNLNTKIEQGRKDDLQDIYDSFNHMTQRLEELVNEVTNEKILNEKAELLLLQAQLNPHFLYNTFDSIYSIAKINKVDTIADIVAALSRFFRVSLSGGKNIVPLKEAVDIARSYLTIQNIRFVDKIQYSIETEDNLMNVTVPKLLIQPLVENAVYHGLERKRGQGCVEIKVNTRGEDIAVTVKDNGVGMTPEKLKKIQDKLYSNEESTENYALRNLARQLKILYKDMGKFVIESQWGVGTCVTIILPLKVKLSEEEQI